MLERIVEIIRLEETGPGTFGVLRINKEVFCWTLEREDLLNKPDESSIPAQQYTCSRYKSDRFNNTFVIDNVPGRSKILFHPFNYLHQTLGCIGLGDVVGLHKGERCILHSKRAFTRFMKVMKDHDKFHLTIKESY